MTMIQEKRLFSSLRRLFDGTIREVIGELLQNSQRATATQVQIDLMVDEASKPSGFTYQDNGQGVSGVAGLATLLTIADSFFENPQIELNQAPMGLGFYSLLSLEGITKVQIISQKVSLELDTKRWFEDADYRESWQERVITFAQSSPGFKLAVWCEEQLITKLLDTLKTYKYYWQIELNPVAGYAGILKVYLGKEQLNTQEPEELYLADPEIVTDYLGCPLRLRFAYHGSHPCLTVNWYGQLIVTKLPYATPWQAYLEVRAGKPVNPLSPSRRGLIQDKAFGNLFAFIADQLFEFVRTASPKFITSDKIKALYKLNAERAERECPYAVLEKWQPTSQHPNSYEDASNHAFAREDLERVFRKTSLDNQLLLNEAVLVPGEEEATAYEYGLASFIAALNLSAFRPVIGAKTDQHLWWRPGALVDERHTTGLGQWGIGTTEMPPAHWFDFPKEIASVFVFEETEDWDATEVKWLIGTTDMVKFLEQYGWSAWWWDDDEDYDRQQTSYEETLNTFIREYLGNAVPEKFEVNDLLRFFEPEAGRITHLELLYEESNLYPHGLTVTTEHGQEKYLRFYA
jgi:hypothetical protein